MFTGSSDSGKERCLWSQVQVYPVCKEGAIPFPCGHLPLLSVCINMSKHGRGQVFFSSTRQDVPKNAFFSTVLIYLLCLTVTLKETAEIYFLTVLEAESLRSGSPMAVLRTLPVSPQHSVHIYVLISSYKDTSHIGLGPFLVTSFNQITSLKALSSSKVTFSGTGG